MNRNSGDMNSNKGSRGDSKNDDSKKNKSDKKIHKKGIKLQGIIDKIYYSNNKFTAGRITLTNKFESMSSISCAGNWVGAAGDFVTLKGNIVIDPKWGKQMAVKSMSMDIDLSDDGLFHYLSKSKMFRGIGPSRAKKIVDAFSGRFDDVIKNRLEEFASVAKIKMDAAKNIQTEWLVSETQNNAITQLMKYDLTLNQSKKIIDKFGDNAVNIIDENPYMLIKEIDGMGFLTVDGIAMKAGHNPKSSERMRAGIAYSIDKETEDGHCYTDRIEIKAIIIALLALNDEDDLKRLEQMIDLMILDGEILKDSRDGDMGYQVDILCSNRVWSNALSVYSTVRILKKYNDENCFKIFGEDAEVNPITTSIRDIAPLLNDQQQQAVLQSHYGSLVLTGGAGTGKSYAIDAIVKLAQSYNKTVALAAPTGKAARRIEESVGGALEAKTIHRLLEYDPKANGFKKGVYDKLDYDIVVIDEFSMVDISMCFNLLSAIDTSRTSVVITGDYNQLPSIGPGNVLRDIIVNHMLPVVHLTDVMRQGGVLKKNCIAILSGEVEKSEMDFIDDTKEINTQWITDSSLPDSITVKNKIMQLYESKRFLANGFDDVEDVQVLSPMRKGGLGTTQLNKMLQQYHQRKYGVHIDIDEDEKSKEKKAKILLHDKVIQTKNDYDINVMNGTLGIVISFDVDDDLDKCVTIKWENGKTTSIKTTGDKYRNIELAYALTVHKTQGSEFPCVVFICHKLHNFMAHRNLFYTAVTRAKKSAIILGDKWGVKNCAKKIKTEKRRTLLPVFAKREK